MGRIQIISIVVSIIFLIVIIELIRKNKILVKYSLLWIFSGLVFLVLSIFKNLLDSIAALIGIAYPPSILILVVIFIGAVLFLHFSIIISKLSEGNKNLTQRLGLLEHEINILLHNEKK